MTDADWDTLRDIVRREVEAAIAVMLAALEEQGQTLKHALPPDVSDVDRQIAQTVAAIWLDQGKRPATTLAVAMRTGWSERHARRLLRGAEQSGAVASIIGRGRRHSGRWIPIYEAA